MNAGGTRRCSGAPPAAVAAVALIGAAVLIVAAAARPAAAAGLTVHGGVVQAPRVTGPAAVPALRVRVPPDGELGPPAELPAVVPVPAPGPSSQ